MQVTKYTHLHLLNLSEQFAAGLISEHEYDVALAGILRDANYQSLLATCTVLCPHLVEALKAKRTPAV